MIKVFKLINGEEIIAKTEVTGLGYTLSDPAAIVIQQTEKGVGVGLAPYMPYAESNITLNATAIATEGIPSKNMANEYNRIFGSGIEVVPASALSGLQIVS
jgi:hypothetical protein